MLSSSHIIHKGIGTNPNHGGGWVDAYVTAPNPYEGMYTETGNAVAVISGLDTQGGSIFAPMSSFSSPPLDGMICNVNGTRVYLLNVQIQGPDYTMNIYRLSDNLLHNGGQSDTVFFGGAFSSVDDTIIGIPEPAVGLIRKIWTNKSEVFTSPIILADLCQGSLGSQPSGVIWEGFINSPGDNPTRFSGDLPVWEVVTAQEFSSSLLNYVGASNISVSRIKAQRDRTAISGKHCVEIPVSSSNCSFNNGETCGGYYGLFHSDAEQFNTIGCAFVDSEIVGMQLMGLQCSCVGAISCGHGDSGFVVYGGEISHCTAFNCDYGGFALVQLSGKKNIVKNCIGFNNNNLDYYTVGSNELTVVVENVSESPLPAEITDYLGASNILTDPEFIDAVNYDFTPQNPDVLRLQAGAIQPAPTLPTAEQMVNGASLIDPWNGIAIIDGVYVPADNVDVRAGVIHGVDEQGACAVPTPANTLWNVDVDDTTGLWVSANPAKYQATETFGVDDNQVGSYAPVPVIPNAPTLALSLAGTTVTATITGNAGVSYELYIATGSGQAWTLSGTIIGSGEIEVADLNAGSVYLFQAIAKGSFDVPSIPSTVEAVTVAVEVLSSGQTKAMIALQQMLAESPTLQTEMAVSGTTEEKIAAAKNNIYFTAIKFPQEEGDAEVTRPYCLIEKNGNDKKTRESAVYLNSGDFELFICGEIDPSNADVDKAGLAEREFVNFYEAVQDEVLALSSLPGYLMINSFDVLEGPGQLEMSGDDMNKYEYGIRLIVNWGIG